MIDNADIALTMFFSCNPPRDEFLCRAEYCKGVVEHHRSKGLKGEVL